jgi:hypothetical protein
MSPNSSSDKVAVASTLPPAVNAAKPVDAPGSNTNSMTSFCDLPWDTGGRLQPLSNNCQMQESGNRILHIAQVTTTECGFSSGVQVKRSA